MTGSSINLEGIYNFRDTGGLVTEDGRVTKTGIIFRSDDFSLATTHDLNLLNSIPLVNIIDFRGYSEREKALDKVPRSVKNLYYVPVELDDVIMSVASQKGGDYLKSMRDAYIYLVEDFKSEYSRFFEIILNISAPVAFHCSAGKDRTGFATALLQLALGVPMSSVYESYMRSKIAAEKRYKDIIEETPDLLPLYTVEKSYLDIAVETIKINYGSVENYLSKVLRVDIQHLHSKYII